VIVTADDFGLSTRINAGIVDGHLNGVVSATSLLMNAPATQEAIEMARSLPRLEIGIHLSIVEGLSLAGRQSSVTDDLAYFGGNELCMIRHWRPFISKWMKGSVNLEHLEAELEGQILAFKRHFPAIPFANSTQHLHLLPGIQDLVLGLCVKHGIKALRIPWKGWIEPVKLKRRLPGWFMMRMGRSLKHKADGVGIGCTDYFAGFNYSGKMTAETFDVILKRMPKGSVTEIMVHPGREDLFLRKNLPWGYSSFDWEVELDAVKSPGVRGLMSEESIRLTTFSGMSAAVEDSGR
jgi:predicted glycoside hydrolase/deacetylase ChbG (UPF0249 family)